ncbi:hypothetical protein FQN53_001052 [Emmonsiellopsis sp. PD_33]|nr:hypothetical protein FQN53_001052 [Emmonsiellopsis sp. PD_33]
MSTTTTTPPHPKRIAQIVRLKPSSIQAYKACHAAVWPTVLAQIKDSNISDYSIFLDERSLTLFATFKWTGTDWEADTRRMRENEEVRRWWEMTDGMQESFNEGAVGSLGADGDGDGGWWVGLEEVFRLE